MNRALRTLLDELIAADDFEVAAQATLRRALALGRRALGRRAVYAEHATLRRGLVHLRPGAGYRGLVLLDEEEGVIGPEPPAASATAWQWVVDGGGPAVLDVALSCFWGLDGTLLEREAGGAFRSRSAMLARSTTHVLVLPLRHGGRAFGMLAVEVACERAVGGRFDAFDQDSASLRLVADLLSPYAASLPAPAAAGDRHGSLPVLGEAMAGVVGMLRTFARFDETLLLRGETGTGKSHLARFCHEASGRADGPYVVVQVHALPEHLRESELLGWRKGAFSGAIDDREGCVARAHGGTLFLDEIDKLPLSAQAKLLGLLEERTYTPLGGSDVRVADVRFVAGTNVDLERAVLEGRFLQDLFYRLNVLPVLVPPLRDRRDELAAWADFMLAALHAKHGGGGDVALSEGALRALRAHPWPGNLRQLHSVLVRAYAFACMSGLGARRVEVGDADVERAVALGGRSADTPLLAAVEAAAAAWVADALSRQERGGTPLELDLTGAFCGFVLEAAVDRTGDEKAAFALFGLEHRLKGGAHLKTLRRERDRVQALLAALEEQRVAS